MNIYAMVPARAGSKGIKQKNIRPLAGRPLIEYSIAYARKLPVDRVICSTDSQEIADIAVQCGAEVPFLRSAEAAGDTAMEEHILQDFYAKLPAAGVATPDLLVWLRPTFVFRSLPAGLRCIERMVRTPAMTACRTVCESESRLYRRQGDWLLPDFPDHGGKSMIRRQDVGTRFKVFSLDVFRGGNCTPYFLGNSIGFEVLPKICGMDIDDAADWMIVEALVNSQADGLQEFLHAAPSGGKPRLWTEASATNAA
jgi:CMP-N-acetylneuraminic acid synthetase